MKSIVITGATSGIGKAAAEEMAARGWQVIGIGRSPQKCEETTAQIRSFYPDSKVAYFTGDLSTQREVNRLADEISIFIETHCGGLLDVLVNNAGCVKDWYLATEDGYETQFAVNHLAGFLLTHKLMPKLEKSPQARVLTVSSGSHYGTSMRWGDIMHRKAYSCLGAYKQSKLCNVLFTHEFNRRMADTTMRAYAVDPALVNTDIGTKGTGGLVRWFWSFRSRHGISPYQAACTITHLCKMRDDFRPAWSYFKDCTVKEPSSASLDPDSGRRLWELSEKLCGIGSGEVRA